MDELMKRLCVISSFLLPIIAYSSGHFPFAPLVSSTLLPDLHPGKPAYVNCILAFVGYSQLGVPDGAQREWWEGIGPVIPPVMLTLVNFISQLKVTASMYPGSGKCPVFSLQSCGWRCLPCSWILHCPLGFPYMTPMSAVVLYVVSTPFTRL